MIKHIAILLVAVAAALPAAAEEDIVMLTKDTEYIGSMPFCVELDNLKDTDAPIHQPAAMLVAAD